MIDVFKELENLNEEIRDKRNLISKYDLYILDVVEDAISLLKDYIHIVQHICYYRKTIIKNY